jgi:uncharacterized protein (TIGR01777 family)
VRVTVTGATGLIGARVVALLRARAADVTVLSRDPEAAETKLEVEAYSWQPLMEPAPADALAGRDVVIHLAGSPVAQRWNEAAKREIRDSRVLGTRNLVAGLRSLGDQCPRTLISSSAIGYYGAHAHEPLDEEAAPGLDFLARTCEQWEAEAELARELGVRVVQLRTGVVLARDGGALAQMLTPFRLGLGGPIAGGQQYVSWIHRDDVAAMILAAAERTQWSGAINATAPEPVSNREFAHALAHALRRPALLALPAWLLRLRFGEMAVILTTGARVIPARALVLGYRFTHARLEDALSAELS